MERALPRRGQKCYTEPKPSRRQRAPGDQEELMLTFNHFNFNVADLDKSLAFYKEALGLEPVGERKAAADGSFIIVYLGDGKTDFRLELTWLRDHPQKYDLGECEFHLAGRNCRSKKFFSARGLPFVHLYRVGMISIQYPSGSVTK